jgi:serine/threonine protein kinase
MERYKILKTVGRGTFGVVYKAVNTATGEVCAIKKLNKKFQSWEECLELREIKSLRKFNHICIIKLKEVFRVNNELHLVFEFMQENVYELIKHKNTFLSEIQIKSIINQVLQGLVYMHRNGFFHRDLKPENIMVTENACKITDFGLAREIRSRPPFTDYVSTRWYRAPEILLRSTTYNSPVDLFALGCIMAELYTLKPLAPGTNENDQMFKLCSILGTPSLIDWPEGYKLASKIGYKFPNCSPTSLSALVPNASYDAIQLLSSLLQWNPQKRPTAYECLEHPYFYKQTEAKRMNNDDIQENQPKWPNGNSRIAENAFRGKWSLKNSKSEDKNIKVYNPRADELPELNPIDTFSPKEPYFPSLYSPKPTSRVIKEKFDKSKLSREPSKEFFNSNEFDLKRDAKPKLYLPRFHVNHPEIAPQSPPKIPYLNVFNNIGSDTLNIKPKYSVN